MSRPMDSRSTIIDPVVDRYVNLDLFYKSQQPDPAGSDCILWTGIKTNIGYGFISFAYMDRTRGSIRSNGAGMMTAHRLAFMIEHGRMPRQRNVNHTCHRKDCVNPAHLVEGTQLEKLAAMKRDRVFSGRRAGGVRGSYQHKQAGRTYKYSEQDIAWIREAAIDDIVQKYQVTKARAYKMRSGFRIGYRWLPWIKK